MSPEALTAMLQSALQSGGPAMLGVLGLIVFGEAIAGLGTLIPGGPLLFSAGALCGEAQGSLPAVLLTAAGAALLGDSFSFYLGRRLAPRIYPLVNRFSIESIRRRCRHRLDRHYALALFFGRMFGPLRSFVPFFCGAGSLPASRFFVTAIPTALSWSLVYAGGGFWAGRQWQTYLPGSAGQFGLWVAACSLLVLAVTPWFIIRKCKTDQPLHGNDHDT